MKCLAVFNSLPDLAYFWADHEFEKHLCKNALKLGLLDPSTVDTSAAIDEESLLSFAGHFFSPLVTSNKYMREVNNSYETMSCENGFIICMNEFSKLSELYFVALCGDGEESELYLQRKISFFHRMLLFVYGPCAVDHLKPPYPQKRKQTWRILNEWLQTWQTLCQQEQMYLVESIERLHVNQDLNSVSLSLLGEVLTRSNKDGNTMHALLLVNNKLLGLYSSERSIDLRTVDILLLIVMIKKRFRYVDELVPKSIYRVPGPFCNKNTTKIDDKHLFEPRKKHSASLPIDIDVDQDDKESTSSSKFHSANSTPTNLPNSRPEFDDFFTPCISVVDNNESESEVVVDESDIEVLSESLGRDPSLSDLLRRHSQKQRKREEKNLNLEQDDLNTEKVFEVTKHNNLTRDNNENKDVITKSDISTPQSPGDDINKAPINITEKELSTTKGAITMTTTSIATVETTTTTATTTTSTASSSTTTKSPTTAPVTTQIPTTVPAVSRLPTTAPASSILPTTAPASSKSPATTPTTSQSITLTSTSITLTSTLSTTATATITSPTPTTRTSTPTTTSSPIAETTTTTSPTPTTRTSTPTTTSSSIAAPRTTSSPTPTITTTTSTTPETTTPSEEKDEPEDVIFHENIFLHAGDETHAPYTAHCLSLGNSTVLVMLSQHRQMFLAFYIQSLLRCLNAMLKINTTKQLSYRQKLLEDSEKFIIRIQKFFFRNSATQTERMGKCFQNFEQSWKSAQDAGLMTFINSDQVSIDMATRLETSISNLLKNVKLLFTHLFIYPTQHQRTILEKQNKLVTVIREIAIRKLSHYDLFLNVRGRRNVTMTAYHEDFPGLVHFLYINRTTDQLIAPTVNVHADSKNDIYLLVKQRIWDFWQYSETMISSGYSAFIVRDGDFCYSYFLWFEDMLGKPLISQKSLKDLNQNKPTGILSGQFYKNVIHYLFPNEPKGRINCYEMLTMHVGVVTNQFIATSCKKLTRVLWEGCAEANSPANWL